MTTRRPATCRAQRGAVLLLTLTFLLLLALLATTVMRTAAMQFRQAGNNLHLERALQQARGIALEVAQRAENFALDQGVAYRRCLADSSRSGCAARDLARPVATPLDEGVWLEVSVTRHAPALLTLPGGDGTATGGLFEIAVELRGDAVGVGNARVAYGVVVPTGGGTPVPVYWREPGADAL